MSSYLLIESRDPFESADVADDYGLARSLAENGDEVTVFLVQNGVLPARRGARAGGLDELVAGGARVVADELSLRERAVPADGLKDGIAPAPLDVVLDALTDGQKVVWL